jgi:hypothetical protein
LRDAGFRTAEEVPVTETPDAADTDARFDIEGCKELPFCIDSTKVL